MTLYLLQQQFAFKKEVGKTQWLPHMVHKGELFGKYIFGKRYSFFSWRGNWCIFAWCLLESLAEKIGGTAAPLMTVSIQ